MKKVYISAAIIMSFVLYASLNGKSMDAINESSSSSNLNTRLPTSSIESVTPGSNTQPTNPLYKDGEYIGPVVDAFYGNIQVKAFIQNGKLTDVQFLQYPNDHSESVEINTDAMPLLKQEAIQAQDAHVDIVSRATDSSKAFIESLSSALQQAQ
jgi:uncharacterized protein with FMN-binding domain